MNEQNEKELMIVEYIKSIKALEDAMEPFKEQRRELRKEYLDDLYDMYGLLAKAKNGAVSNAS